MVSGGVPYYLVYRATGLMGIETVMLSVICVYFLGILYLCYQKSGNIKSSVLACCFASFLAEVVVRPAHHFVWLCFSGRSP